MKNLFKNSNFQHDIDGQECASFDIKYISEVRNYSNIKSGVLSIFLFNFIKERNNHLKNGKVYLNKGSVEFILNEINYFKENKKWREVK